MLSPAAGEDFIPCKSLLRGEGKREELRASNPLGLEQPQLPREVPSNPSMLATPPATLLQLPAIRHLLRWSRRTRCLHLLHPDLSGTASWEAEAPSPRPGEGEDAEPISISAAGRAASGPPAEATLVAITAFWLL